MLVQGQVWFHIAQASGWLVSVQRLETSFLFERGAKGKLKQCGVNTTALVRASFKQLDVPCCNDKVVRWVAWRDAWRCTWHFACSAKLERLGGCRGGGQTFQLYDMIDEHYGDNCCAIDDGLLWDPWCFEQPWMRGECAGAHPAELRMPVQCSSVVASPNDSGCFQFVAAFDLFANALGSLSALFGTSASPWPLLDCLQLPT